MVSLIFVALKWSSKSSNGGGELFFIRLGTIDGISPCGVHHN